MRRYLWTGLAVLAFAAPAPAEPAADDRWLAFQGCWRPAEGGAGALLCIVPDGNDVRFVELTNGSITRDTRMSADNQPRPVSAEGCTGTERARWSANGKRLYLNTDLSCGANLGRSSSGIFALLSPTEWVSVSAIAVDDEAATRTIRYVAVESPANVPADLLAGLQQNRLARETARMAADDALALDELKEASTEVHGRAVEALLHARGQKYELNGRKLLALADAGVPDYLIDAVVAVSNPEKFDVRTLQPVEVTPGSAEPAASETSRRRYCARDIWYDRYCDDSFFGMSRYGLYSPFGYGAGYYNYGYQGVPIIVIADPNAEPHIPGDVSRSGYRKGRASATSTSGSRVSRSASGSRASGSSSGSASSSSGSSSSGGSSDRGKAKARGN